VSPILLSLLAFVPVLLGILVGGWVQGKLPEGHQSSDSKEVVKLSLGIMGTLAALVLGLLVASAQSSYAARETEIKQLTAYVILLDHLLDQYGKDAESVRVSLRNVVPRVADRIWREGQSTSLQAAPFKVASEGEGPTAAGDSRYRASAIPSFFAPGKLDPNPLFGRAVVLAHSPVRGLCAFGATKCHDVSRTHSVRALRLSCNLPLIGA
jgi:hypothetical protein